VNVHEFLHASGEVDGGAAIGDFDLAPGPMHVEEDEQVRGAVAFILAVVALDLARLGLDGTAISWSPLPRSPMARYRARSRPRPGALGQLDVEWLRHASPSAGSPAAPSFIAEPLSASADLLCGDYYLFTGIDSVRDAPR
jgi:hypothetical protein